MVKSNEMRIPTGHVGDEEAKNLSGRGGDLSLVFIEHYLHQSMVEDPANKISCFLSSLCSFLVLLEIVPKNQLELHNSLALNLSNTNQIHLMCTAWWTKYVWLPQHKVLSSLLTTPIVIAAESHNTNEVYLLHFVDHTLKCHTHRCTILLMCIMQD